MTTTTDVAPHGSALSLTTDQDTFTPRQRAMLAHMGVENAPEEDLAVFLHIAQRTGLDPFARQIHMIGRNQKTRMPDGSERWVTKYTIQTGIDGFRVTGRRAADRAKIDVSVPAPEWAHEDGTWRPVWSSKWGRPVAARVTIMRGDRAFVGVALFEEYAQTKRDGGLTQMWAQRPAGQLAKCAEALAWRMAFPQDLAFVYSDDEMHQADNQTGPREVTAEPARATASVFAATADEPEAMSDEQRAAPKKSPRRRTSSASSASGRKDPLALWGSSALLKSRISSIVPSTSVWPLSATSTSMPGKTRRPFTLKASPSRGKRAAMSAYTWSNPSVLKCSVRHMASSPAEAASPKSQSVYAGENARYLANFPCV